jgi:hypothetical protein
MPTEGPRLDPKGILASYTIKEVVKPMTDKDEEYPE